MGRMREYVGDWKRDWIKENGETDDFEVVIVKERESVDDKPLYEGSFASIPDELLTMRVIKCSKIMASSIPEREGAYRLVI